MSVVTPSSLPERDPRVEWSAFGRDAVLFHALSKQYLVLNGMAREIWERCDGQRTVEGIATEIAREYGEPLERVGHDVSDTIEGLWELGLLGLGDQAS